MIEQVNSIEDFEAIIHGSSKVLMEFYRRWCPRCKSFYPVLDEASVRLNAQKVTVAQIEIERFDQLADYYDIQSAPTMTFFENGMPLSKKKGETDTFGIIDFVDSAIGKD